MLGIFGVIVLVVGGFSAGGAIFDWPFLFSDGYREYNWVRSAGREGARGMLILFGGILVVVGFVAQVVDAASRTSLQAGRGSGPGQFAQSPKEGAAVDEPPTDSAAVPTVATPPATEAPQVAGPSMGQVEPPSGAGSAATPAATVSRTPTASTAAAWQSLTIFEPEAVPQESNTLLVLKYRFEEGHRPLAGAHYIWVTDALDKTAEVEYDAGVMQQQGQLTHIVRAPFVESGFDRTWSTSIVVEINGRRQPASNTLHIAPGEEVRSDPPPAPR
ncbi:MAG: hypothetical protein B7Z73_00980 [Planctomycetia bacterium 21-64-5]|nr:MAG: hypothetical protein B7Z73_00980 [Planctomycetia bacterium 21-64-5]HQU42095.1 hypothetical protein [Pirellulales bacterium]